MTLLLLNAFGVLQKGVVLWAVRAQLGLALHGLPPLRHSRWLASALLLHLLGSACLALAQYHSRPIARALDC